MKRSFGDVFFLAVFVPYTALATLLLALGLGSALATLEPLRERFVAWAAEGGAASLFFLAMARAARFVEPPPQIVVDFLLSVLNIGLALFLVWRRPVDVVARIFAFALVGTAMAYNYQTHGVVAIAAGLPQAGGIPPLAPLNVAHFMFHAVSGAAYVHALLVFPTGRVVPRALGWLPPTLYGIALEETALPLYGRLFGSGDDRTPGLIVTILNSLFGLAPLRTYERIVDVESVFFVVLFGVLVPLVGVGAQVYRYRHAASPEDRAQTRLVVWTLTLAFSLGLALIAVGVFGLLARGVIFSFESSEVLEDLVLRLSTPLFAVVPIALIVAMLRYRLFDVAIVVDRSFVYAPLTATLAVIFLGSLWLLQQALRSLLGGPAELAIIAAAGLNAILFQPLRRRLQSLIDRRFFPAPSRDASPEAAAPAKAT